MTVTYKFKENTSERTYEGGTGFPGLCKVRAVLKKNRDGSQIYDRQSVTVAGMFIFSKAPDPSINARNVLPVLQGKSKSVTFAGVGTSSISMVTFEYVDDEPIDIGGEVFPAKRYTWTERYLFANAGVPFTTFDALYVTDRDDKEIPLFVGTQTSKSWSQYPEADPAKAIRIVYHR